MFRMRGIEFADAPNVRGYNLRYVGYPLI